MSENGTTDKRTGDEPAGKTGEAELERDKSNARSEPDGAGATDVTPEKRGGRGGTGIAVLALLVALGAAGYSGWQGLELQRKSEHLDGEVKDQLNRIESIGSNSRRLSIKPVMTKKDRWFIGTVFN